MNTPPTPISPVGLLVIDKPLRRSSMDVCRVVRRRLVLAGAPKRVKVGHGGTLDPLATGVLVVLVGKATRMCDEVMAGQKEYDAEVDLSAFTTTDDAEGQRTEVVFAGQGATCMRTGGAEGSAVIVASRDAPPSLEDIRAASRAFVGEIMQRPPAFSALKVDGRRAYDLARRGQAVDLPARPVRIDEIEVLEYRWPIVRLRITSGKGVYIRSLARDLGAALGVGGTLASLRRTRVGVWDMSLAVALERLPERLTQGDLRPV
jgi:tRNA pseudouridine55 synthase